MKKTILKDRIKKGLVDGVQSAVDNVESYWQEEDQKADDLFNALFDTMQGDSSQNDTNSQQASGSGSGASRRAPEGKKGESITRAMIERIKQEMRERGESEERIKDLTKKEIVLLSASVREVAKRKISMILRDNLAQRFESGHRTGKLAKKLYKSATNCVNLFRKKFAKKSGYEIKILCDVSGSMESRLTTTISAVVNLLQVFEKISGVDVEVFTFNEFLTPIYNGGKVEHGEIDEKIREAYDFVDESGYGCQNCDGQFVNEVSQKFTGKKQSVLLVLSDGAPSGCYSSNPRQGYRDKHHVCKRAFQNFDRNIDRGEHEVLKEEIKKSEKAGIKVGSIGIESDAPRRFYRVNECVDDITTDLFPATMRVLQRLII
jgi:cobalamin biosynthesis protein CobT